MLYHDIEERISRRSFVRSAAAGAGGLALGHGLVGSSYVWAEGPGPLLPPIVTGNSPEICLNSRLSYHSGLTGTATDQQIANVLWAAGRAPFVGALRTIYLKTVHGTYVYHPEDHSLESHSTETVAVAFRLNFDRELDYGQGELPAFQHLLRVAPAGRREADRRPWASPRAGAGPASRSPAHEGPGR